MSYKKVESVTFTGGRVVVGYSSEWCEYRVRVYRGSIALDRLDYGTDCKSDAIETAHSMADTFNHNTNVRSHYGFN